jgi:hypothetical protein
VATLEGLASEPDLLRRRLQFSSASPEDESLIGDGSSTSRPSARRISIASFRSAVDTRNATLSGKSTIAGQRVTWRSVEYLRRSTNATESVDACSVGAGSGTGSHSYLAGSDYFRSDKVMRDSEFARLTHWREVGSEGV